MSKETPSQVDNLYLVFFNPQGEDYRSRNIYELIFSKTPELCTNETWDTTFPDPPDKIFIDSVARIVCNEITFNSFKDSSIFTMEDVKDGVICLAYEKNEENLKDEDFLEDYLDEENVLKNKPLVFHYGLSKAKFLKLIEGKKIQIQWLKN